MTAAAHLTLTPATRPLAGRTQRCAHCGAVRPVASPATIETYAVDAIAADLDGVPDDCWRFFRTLFLCDPGVRTSVSLARELSVHPSTLNSRFLRERLPTPKTYLAWARLVRVAHRLEDRRRSRYPVVVVDVMRYSGLGAFGRHVRNELHMGTPAFREQLDGRAMVDLFRERLVVPYRDRLLNFRPLIRREAL
jgi:hypothetical protein